MIQAVDTPLALSTPFGKFGHGSRVVNLLSGCPEISGFGQDDRDLLRDDRDLPPG